MALTSVGRIMCSLTYLSTNIFRMPPNVASRKRCVKAEALTNHSIRHWIWTNAYNSNLPGLCELPRNHYKTNAPRKKNQTYFVLYSHRNAYCDTEMVHICRV